MDSLSLLKQISFDLQNTCNYNQLYISDEI